MTELHRAIRVFLKSPGFTAVAIVSLALGIGANSAIFSLFNALALRTLAAPQPDRLAGLFTVDATGERGNFSYATFEQIRARQQSFASLFLWTDSALRTFEAGGTVFPGGALLASEGFAETMGMRPVIGRGIAAGDGEVAILGYQCWRRYFQGSPAALGKTIRVQGKACTVVGVAPEDFTSMEASGPIDAIIPLNALVPPNRLHGDRSPVWEMTGRLKPGVTLAGARAEMEALWPQIKLNPRSRIQVESAARGTGFNFARRRFTFPLQVLMAFTGLLLLLASVNLATLLLARADSQVRETGIRLALGAGRGRVMRQYLTESLLLSGAGALAGALGARWAVRYLAQFVWTGNIEKTRDVPLDGNVIGFTVAVAVMGGAIFGLIPAWRALRTDPWVSMRQGSVKVSGGAGRVERMLVVLQVTVSLVLMVASTLFTGTLRHLHSISPGRDASDVLGMQLMNRPNGYRGMDPVSYYSGLFERLARIPGVRAVSSASRPPVMPPVFPDQAIAAGGATADAQVFLVTPGFFETMQIPLTAGRDFTFHDAAHTPAVAIVSESLAHSLFPSGEAVGQHVTVAGDDAGELIIAGVARDSTTGSLQKHNSRQVFRSVFQVEDAARQPYVLVRSAGRPTGALAEQLRKEVEALGREYPIRTETMERAIARALVQERLMASLAGGLGVMALLLAAVGIYGLMSHSVTRRTHDIGIRMALGAKQGTIVTMIIRESLMLVGAGFALSVPAVYAGSRMVSTMLYGVRPLDPAALGTAAVVLVGSALLAVFLPARRAAKLDPMVALRCE